MSAEKEEFTQKIVGRRKPCSGGLEKANPFLKMIIQLRGKQPFIPRGVYRFKTHEEKDAWSMKMMARSSRARRPSRT